jgi:GNAT superfamily N-acetyltransferase
MPIEVRNENPNSQIAIELIQELSTELGTIYGDDGSGAFTPKDVTVARSAFVIAWLDGEAVGCGALRPMKDANAGEIKRMYVRKDARGRGISRQILAKLEALAHEYDYERVILETGTLQAEAVNLYATSGYTQMVCYAEYVDNPYSICYEKRLPQV